MAGFVWGSSFGRRPLVGHHACFMHNDLTFPPTKDDNFSRAAMQAHEKA